MGVAPRSDRSLQKGWPRTLTSLRATKDIRALPSPPVQSGVEPMTLEEASSPAAQAARNPTFLCLQHMLQCAVVIAELDLNEPQPSHSSTELSRG